MSRTSDDEIRTAVRDNYAVIAESDSGGCCGTTSIIPVSSALLGYSDDELSAIPEGADLGLGCGNPAAIAAGTPMWSSDSVRSSIYRWRTRRSM